MKDYKEVSLRLVAMPSDTNPAGNIFGGWIMSQIDLAGSVAAKEVANGRVVTIAVDKMTFKKPVFVGDIVSFYAKIINVGTTSIQVSVEVVAERCTPKLYGVCTDVTSAVLTYVNVDENGNKIPISEENKKRAGF
ncbi:acyl-CoA thioesterase [Campylobacter canadensis]|uniref:Acyl-CoA thioesterase n=1 Tax=Campylobacter canadensis TaxID=449520 RepID=A0ABS7WP00_9BACT|nr:acyl-CoA thioesterase [Campylobacter canadensis]MBZ7986504.1 acyl-CoA thioesterase [Campylobacter canadensis]MBZ7994093.1 acyl-CoA thioesterase [Campylobacter canadensis]MBZ7995904.1 acyl-CoA thioesterase [Campylobacter canadensis]MBZ7997541.1 acyl-CoA thioesterase [Campylobacter canadensis]MBZ7999424.1 acyl-CoA thioesterase [Campylobacter canadensis]